MYDVSIVIPTFRRPHLLEKTVASLMAQNNASKLAFEIIIVDNCPEKSAEGLVAGLIKSCEVPIQFVSEPRQNIALARNAGIDRSNADFVAMVDDDMEAPPDWLDQHYTTIKAFDADVVLGPTIPHFEIDPPKWIKDDNTFDRRRNIPTGTVLREASSGNSFLRSATCFANNNRFYPVLGRSGGSDTDFFMRLARRMGCKIVWCSEAAVKEFIRREQLTVGYMMRRTFQSNQSYVYSSIRSSDHPIRMAAYLMFVVGCSQIAIWIIPSLISAPFQTAYSIHARMSLVRGLGKLFWGKPFRFNFY